MDQRVVIQWTETAKKQLAALPLKVRRGLLEKARALRECDTPESAHKPLTGPLSGYYRITYARYRAVYTVRREPLPRGESVSVVRVLFVAAGQRKERDRQDIYRIAEKLVALGLIEPGDAKKEDEEQDDESE